MTTQTDAGQRKTTIKQLKGDGDAGTETRTKRRKTGLVKWQNDDRTDMDGPNRDEQTSDDGRTTRQRRREVTETIGDGDGAGRQGRGATQGDGADGQNRTKTNDDGAARARPQRQPNNDRNAWNRPKIVGMVAAG